MKQLLIVPLAALAFGLSSCSKSGGDSIDLKDQTAINRVSECPQISGKYCLEDRSDCTNYDLSGGTFHEGSDYDSNPLDIPIDGAIHDKETYHSGNYIQYKAQAYCSGGTLTVTIHAGDKGAAREVITGDDRSIRVEVKGVGRASKNSGTHTYYKR